MVKAQATTMIARPAEPVFDFIAADFFANYPRWSPEVVELKRLSPGPLQVGTRARQVRVDQGRRTDAVFQVSALERPRRVEFQGATTPFLISYRLDSLEGGTRLTFVFELRRLELYMRPFEKLIRVAVQDSAERVVRNIKGLVEKEIPPPDHG
jgi:hypothetical protein